MKNLYLPIGQEVVLKEKMFFVPQRGEFPPFSFPGWSADDLFGNNNPVIIEYCSGNGSWILERAKNNPHQNFLAVEIQFMRARKIWKKIHSFALPNIVIAWAEGVQLTSLFIPDASIQEVFVNFPDPWPKRRHAKHRIIKKEFVSQMERIIKKEGHLTLVTDDETYSEIMIQVMQKSEIFRSVIGSPYYAAPPPDFGTSFFDELFRKKGKQIRFHRYLRT